MSPEIEVGEAAPTPELRPFEQLPIPGNIAVPSQEGEQMTPLIPKWLLVVASLLAPALLALVPVLPPPFNFIVLCVAMVAAFLAGKPLPQPSIAASKPVIPIVLVPIVGTLVPALISFSSGLTNPVLKFGAYVLALVLCWLAGVALPPPQQQAQ